jgi:16S rRNA (cytosine1402-N4)-methyltransferase
VSTESNYHEPVLARQVVDLLVTDPDGIYIDCTVGGGGHSRLIIEKLSEKGSIFGCDCDSEALNESRRNIPDGITLVQSRFSELEARLKPLMSGGAAGVLMDLGVSSHQIDTAERGFSHRYSGPLDLRMDPTRGETASDLLARLDVNELTRLIREFGEDSQARRIAKAMARQRISSTDELAAIIDRTVPATRNKSLARVFQALRIAVNDELGELKSGLDTVWRLMRPGGRLVVISYHSLEDRIVKTFMKGLSQPQTDPLGLPFAVSEPAQALLLVRKPLLPDSAEIASNPRARSAKLRALEKLI